MNFKAHAILYYILLAIFIGCTYTHFSWSFFLALTISFWIIDPDEDQQFHNHRDAITHSLFFPLLVYWCLHPFVNLVNATDLGIVLMFPVMIHLLGDLKVIDVMQMDKKELGGSYQISFFGKRLGIKGSVFYVTCNIICMALLIVYWGWYL